MKRVPGSVVDEMVLMNAVDELTYDRLWNILQIEMKDVDRKYDYVVAGAPEMLVLLCVAECSGGDAWLKADTMVT